MQLLLPLRQPPRKPLRLLLLLTPRPLRLPMLRPLLRLTALPLLRRPTRPPRRRSSKVIYASRTTAVRATSSRRPGRIASANCPGRVFFRIVVREWQCPRCPFLQERPALDRQYLSRISG